MKAKKHFGQHFLVDPWTIEAIVQAINPKDNALVIEIGPGRGAITAPLIEKLGTLTAIEIDKDVKPWLEPLITKGLTLIEQDVLKVNWEAFHSPCYVLGNLPYNISTPLLIRLLRHTAIIPEMIFMVQKEVAHRITAKPHNKSFGRLSVMIQAFGDVELLFDVAPAAFSPPPKVDSAVFRFVSFKKPKLDPDCFKAFELLITRAFNQRRKKLRNNLKGFIDTSHLDALGISDLRPEDIATPIYIELFHRIHTSTA